MSSQVIKVFKNTLIFLSLVFLPIYMGVSLLHLWSWDFSIPLAYGNPGADEIWQLVATKTLIDTGWILENAYLGAPDISTWYANSASQISVLHQFMMIIISFFVKDAIAVQQYYFLISFSLITLTTFALAKVLKINVLVSILIGLIFTTTSYRMNSFFFAYLANYWVIPLTLIPIYYLLQNTFMTSVNDKFDNNEKLYFFIGIIVSALVAITDGYYAFFYLLLLGFVIVNQFFNGEYSNLKRVTPPLVFILVTVGTSLIITSPLREHRTLFAHEANQDAMKNAIDAEVYVPTLKLLITPTFDHRVKLLDDFGKSIIETANFNRRFPYTMGAPVVLGIFGSILLFAFLIRLLITNRLVSDNSKDTHYESIVLSSSKLSVFIFLCSIAGGIGTLIALFYPSIRAYERFPIYLVLTLYIGAGAFLTHQLNNSNNLKKYWLLTLIFVGSFLIILDQTRADPLGLSDKDGAKDLKSRFLGEKALIQRVEQGSDHPKMVYQYPYSQYLTNNKYYGWGQFGHLRAYLHSKDIRWSNGAAKGSYIDTWHEKKSSLPLDDLIVEMMSVGFDGLMVDRLVVSDKEFNELKKTLSRFTKIDAIENVDSKMAFWKLPKSHVLLKYDNKFKDVASLFLDKEFDVNSTSLPKIVNKKELINLLDKLKPTYPVEFSAKNFPVLFHEADLIEKGLGFSTLKNDEIKGGVECLNENNQTVSLDSSVRLTVSNKGNFDWRFDSGVQPLRVGIMVRDQNEQFISDSRVDVNQYVEMQETIDLELKLSKYLNVQNLEQFDLIKVKIRLLQDGNRWFDGKDVSECSLSISLH